MAEREPALPHPAADSRACPLCGGDAAVAARVRARQIVDSSPYYDAGSWERLGVSPDAAFGISRCRSCDFAFASRVPSGEFLERLYGGGGDTADAVRTFARPARAAYAFRALSRLLAALAERVEADPRGVAARPLAVLDVGCAYGVGILGLARAHYPYQVTAVEPSAAARAYLAGQGIDVFATLEDVPGGRRFDGILLNDVLEHVPDPLPFVRALATLARPGAVAWVNVPNFIGWRLDDGLRRADAGHTPLPQDLNPWEHLSYFSPASLDRLMAQAGARRLEEDPVQYPVGRGSAADLCRSWARAARDLWRIHSGRYPREYTTSALYGFEE